MSTITREISTIPPTTNGSAAKGVLVSQIEAAPRVSAIRVIEKPMVFFDDEPLCEDSNDFPPLTKHRLSARAIVRGAMPSHFEPDEELSQ